MEENIILTNLLILTNKEIFVKDTTTERGDIHVHIDGHATKQEVIEYLKKAECMGIKKLCLLEHDKLNALKILEEIAKTDGIDRYYSGELVLGVEFSTMLDCHHTNPDGTNYDGFVSHLLVYMPLDEAHKLYRNKTLIARDKNVDYVADYNKLVTRIKNIDNSLEIPKLEDLKACQTPHIVKDLRKWIMGDEQRKEKYRKALGITEEQFFNDSAFIRQLAENPQGVLYYKPEFMAYTSQLLEIIKKETPKSKVVIAHPFYMVGSFNAEYYLQTLLSVPNFTAKPNIDGVEVGYMLNTPEQTKFLDAFATQNNLLKTHGTDANLGYKEMFYVNDGKKYYYTPRLGWPVATAYYNGNLIINGIDGKNMIKLKNTSDDYMVDSTLFSDILADFGAYIAQKGKKNDKNCNGADAER